MAFQHMGKREGEQRSETCATRYPASDKKPPRPAGRPSTVADPENESFHRDEMKERRLGIRQKNESITPGEREQLGVLQAKVDDFWAKRMAGG